MANRIPRVPVRGFAGSVQVPALQESALRFSLSCECKHT